MKYDLLSTKANTSIKSYVLAVNVWDSDSQKKIDFTSIPSGMLLDIVGNNTDKTKTYLVSFLLQIV